MADEAVVLEEDISPVQSPLVEVSFQTNVNRKQKYLEAEPKGLGITQIGLSLYNIICACVFLAEEVSFLWLEIPSFIASILVIIAGCVALAAQNLHLPTLRACLGMQIVAACACVVNMSYSLVKTTHMPVYCWHYYFDNDTHHYGDTCHQVEKLHLHFYAGSLIIQAALFALSVTLVVYCCKVVNCCSPGPKMPVITVQAPPVQQ